jgi:hypothetical protein
VESPRKPFRFFSTHVTSFGVEVFVVVDADECLWEWRRPAQQASGGPWKQVV